VSDEPRPTPKPAVSRSLLKGQAWPPRGSGQDEELVAHATTRLIEMLAERGITVPTVGEGTEGSEKRRRDGD
jgi:hypothetical protein